MTSSTAERIVSMPIRNPDSSGASRTFTYKGKVDMLDGHTLVDWKTCSDPEQAIEKITVGYQAELYALALEHEGVELHEIEYRLIQKPTIKLCKRFDDMNPEHYAKRCFEWLCEKPGAVRTHPVFLNPARLQHARHWLWNISKRLLECRTCNRWLTNENACHTWKRSCEFVPLCMTEVLGGSLSEIIDERYEERPCQHEELGDVGPNVLTYSSASTLTLCERRYLWCHELRLRRRDDETSPALYVGSAAHVGLKVLVDDGLGAAFEAIKDWGKDHLVLGEDAHIKQQQHLAQAQAIVRAAQCKWLEAP